MQPTVYQQPGTTNQAGGTSLHRAALAYARKGKMVFPCKADKSPYVMWKTEASTDARKLTAWWNRWQLAKIGLATGKISGVFVVDVDRLEALGELPGELPETLTIRTPSGGLHFYYNHVDGVTNRSGALPAGIDVRGEGGYAIMPPSEGYTVHRRAQVAEAPAWLLEALREQPRRTGGSGPGRSGGKTDTGGTGSIPDGTRNNTLTRIAGRLHDGTRDLPQLEDDLADVNDARCVPPLPHEQVRKIAQSIYRYEPCRPAGREPDSETVAALADIEAKILRHSWKGKGGKTRYSIAAAALKLARWYGELVEGGVRVEVSARQLALAAAVSRSSIMRNLKKMGEMLRPDNEGASEGKAGALVLLSPPARTDTTPPTEGVVSADGGGCVSSRAPLSAPRLRWSSPAFKPRRGLVKGTSKVRNAPPPEKRAAVIRLGKSCERVMDSLEAAGGTMTLAALAAAIDVKQPRDLTRRKNPDTGKNRDGFVTRLEAVGVLQVAGDTVTLTEDWLEALDRERDRAGEVALYKRDMARYNREREAYRNREEVEADGAPSVADMDEYRETRPPLAGDAERAYKVLVDSTTRAARAYSAGADAECLAGALAAYFGDYGPNDPAGWRRWIDPATQAAGVLDGVATGAAA